MIGQYKTVLDMICNTITDQDELIEYISLINDRKIITALVGRRVAANMSQEDVGNLIGLTAVEVNKIEDSCDDDCNLAILRKYARAVGLRLKCSLEYDASI